MDKEELIKNFVGVKYEKLYKKNFSIFALIFGWCYFIYRKMLLAGFGFLILQTAISSFFNTLDKFTVIISYLLINLSLSLLFNSMYRNYVQKKVSIIMATSQSEEQAIKKCIKKGGTSVGLVVLSIIITIILTIIFTLIYGVIFVVNSAVDFVKDNVDISINEESFYDNTITIFEGGGFSAVGEFDNLNENITYKLDEKFEKSKFWENKYEYKDGDAIAFNEVTIEMLSCKNIIFDGEAKNQYKEEKKIINGKEWIIYKYDERDEWIQENENSEYYDIKIFAVLKINNINLVVYYSIQENVEDKEGAMEKFNNIIESIQYK